MAELSGKSPEELERELAGVIYRDIRCAENPEDILPSLVDLSRYPLVTADEYLSGKVRQKLRMAKAFLEVAPDNQKETARRNVEALEAVQPQDLGAGEIGVRIGANWVPIEVYQQFMVELLTPNYYVRDLYQNHALRSHRPMEYPGEKRRPQQCKSQYHLRHQADERLPHSGADSKSKGCAGI